MTRSQTGEEDDGLSAFVAQEKRRPQQIFEFDDWDQIGWILRLPHQSHRCVRNPRLSFTADAGRTVPFAEPFASFARAVCSYDAFLRRNDRSESPIRVLVNALRLLYAELVPATSPQSLLGQHFNAAEAATRGYDPDYASKIAGKLEFIAGIIEDRGTSASSFRWKRNGPVVRPFDPEHLKRKEPGRLLNDDQVKAWAALSAAPPEVPLEHIYQRVVDIAFCGGFRIGEACTVPADALVMEIARDQDGNIIRGDDGSAIVQYGLRYWPEKAVGGQTLVKAIPSVMAPIAIRAVEELLALTEKWRAVARAHFDRRSPFDGTPLADLPDDHELHAMEIASLDGSPHPTTRDGRRFIRLQNVPHRPGTFRDGKGKIRRTLYVKKCDLIKALRDMSYLRHCIPREDGFVALHDCLVVLPVGIRLRSKGCDFAVRPLKASEIGLYLGGDKDKRSIFERRDLRDRDGNVIRMIPSQIRFWVNTLAFAGHLNQVVLARWMGRTCVAANATYDGRNISDITKSLNAAFEEMGVVDADEASDFKAVARDDAFFEEDEIGHVTVAGVCSHEFASPPCQAFVDSLEDPDFDEFLEAMPQDGAAVYRRRLERLAASAALAASKGVPGADAWAELYDHLLERTAWLVHFMSFDRAATAVAEPLELPAC